MNKQECKKYIKQAYINLVKQNKSLNLDNIEFEMKKVFKMQMLEYIAYSKISMHNIKKSGNLEIKLEDILAQIDILPAIYSKDEAIKVANKL